MTRARLPGDPPNDARCACRCECVEGEGLREIIEAHRGLGSDLTFRVVGGSEKAREGNARRRGAPMGHLAAHEDPGCDGEKPNTTTSTSPGRWQGEGGCPRHRERGKRGGGTGGRSPGPGETAPKSNGLSTLASSILSSSWAESVIQLRDGLPRHPEPPGPFRRLGVDWNEKCVERHKHRAKPERHGGHLPE